MSSFTESVHASGRHDHSLIVNAARPANGDHTGRPWWLRLKPRARAVPWLGALLALMALLSAFTTSSAWASGLAATPQPGSYTGGDSQGFGVSFYVSANSQQVQDVSVNPVGLSCSNGTTESDANFDIATATITSGAFTATSAQSGEVGGKPATITYTFTGQFASTTAAGQLSEVIKYKTGTTVTCTSGSLSWSASPSAQGSQVASPPQPGSYTGSDTQGFGVSFYVSANSKQVQDVSVNPVGLSCSSGASESDANFDIATATITSGGFTATSAQSGEVGGKPATISYTFTGHFHGLNTAGNQRAAGQLKEVIKYKTGTTVTCTSNDLSWTAALSAQGSQVASPPQPGSYTGSDTQGFGVSFYVSANSKQVQDVSVNPVGLSCSSGASESDANFDIATAAITSGAFTAKSAQSGVVGGKPATLNYKFVGHFHGLNTSGNQRVAGQLTEVITYPTGTSVTCTSNKLSWSASLSAQGSQMASPPQPGSYTGSDTQGFGVSFAVSANSQQVQDVSVNPVGLSCSNGTTESDGHFTIASAPITSGTTFTGTSVQTDPTETITYTFTGHFHGLNTSGNQRAAGQLSEVIQSTSGTTVTCTSNDLSWTATS